MPWNKHEALAASMICFILKATTGSFMSNVRRAWPSFHIPRAFQNNIRNWGKHGERRGGQKTPLGYLLFGRSGGSIPCRDVGAVLRGRKPGAHPPAGVSSGLAIAVRVAAVVGAEAAGLGEAAVQHLCRLDAQHLILVSVDCVFNGVFLLLNGPTCRAEVRSSVAGSR